MRYNDIIIVCHRAPNNDAIVTHTLVSDQNIFRKEKKYVEISPRSGAHDGERIMLLSKCQQGALL